MTPEQLQKEAREHFRNATKRPFTKEDTEALNNFHDELVAKAFLAGEKSGRNKAIDEVWEGAEGLMLEKNANIIITKVLEKARTN